MELALIVAVVCLALALLVASFVYSPTKIKFTQFGVLTAVMLFVVAVLLGKGVIPPIAVIPIAAAWGWLRRNDERVKKEIAEAIAAEATQENNPDSTVRAE